MSFHICGCYLQYSSSDKAQHTEEETKGYFGQRAERMAAVISRYPLVHHALQCHNDQYVHKVVG